MRSRKRQRSCYHLFPQSQNRLFIHSLSTPAKSIEINQHLQRYAPISWIYLSHSIFEILIRYQIGRLQRDAVLPIACHKGCKAVLVGEKWIVLLLIEGVIHHTAISAAVVNNLVGPTELISSWWVCDDERWILDRSYKLEQPKKVHPAEMFHIGGRSQRNRGCFGGWASTKVRGAQIRSEQTGVTRRPSATRRRASGRWTHTVRWTHCDNWTHADWWTYLARWTHSNNRAYISWRTHRDDRAFVAWWTHDNSRAYISWRTHRDDRAYVT